MTRRRTRRETGLTLFALPQAAAPVASYVLVVGRRHGLRPGHALHRRPAGHRPAGRGRFEEQGYAAARACGLMLVLPARKAAGLIGRVARGREAGASLPARTVSPCSPLGGKWRIGPDGRAVRRYGWARAGSAVGGAALWAPRVEVDAIVALHP